MSLDLAMIERDYPELVDDLLAEIGEKNTVRAVVHRSGKYELVGDSTSQAFGPMLYVQDRLRVSNGLKALWVPELVRRTGGELVGWSPNLRTNIGNDYQAAQTGGAGSTTIAKYVALSNNTNAAAAANTSANTTNTRICWGTASATDAAASTSRGEYTALGMARAAATYAHTTSAGTFTQTITFTSATGNSTNLQACGLLDSVTQGAGSLYCENTFTATSLVAATSDQLTITWTVTM